MNYNVMQLLQTQASEVFQSSKVFILLIKCDQQSVFFTGYLLMWGLTSGFQKTTRPNQSSCFSSSVSPPPARRARGSGRPLVQVCSSGVTRCTRCGKGRPACTSRSRWKEGQSREWSVKEWQEVRDECISVFKSLTIDLHREGCGLLWVTKSVPNVSTTC